MFEQLAATTEVSPARPAARVLGDDYLGYPSLLSIYGLAQTRPHNPMAPEPYLEVLDAAFGFAPGEQGYFAPVERLSAPWLDFLGIAAVWSTVEPESDNAMERSAGLEPAGSFDPFVIWQNPDAAPPWRLTNSWQALSVGPNDEAGAELRAWRPEDGVLVQGGASRPPEPQGGTAGRLELRSYRSGRVELDIRDRTSGAAALLVTSWPGPSGWSVRWAGQDGRGGVAEPIRVQGAFLGAWIPAEATRLVIRYVPPGWWAGVVLSCLAGMLWCAIVLRLRRSRSQVAFSSG